MLIKFINLKQFLKTLCEKKISEGQIEEFYKNIINNNFDINISDEIKYIAW